MRFKNKNNKQTFAKPTGIIKIIYIKKRNERIIYLVCCNLLGFAIDFNKYSRNIYSIYIME